MVVEKTQKLREFLSNSKHQFNGLSTVIQQGAEAVLIKRGDVLLKCRVAKGYRLKEIDEKIRRLRTRSESRLLSRAGKIVPVPKIIQVDEEAKEIEMEFIDGEKLSESLNGMNNWKEVCVAIGQNIANLHDANIIHGDLTTSNMILTDGEVFFIDFGLGFFNGKIEDKAVDLHLIKQALEAKHFEHFEKFWKAVVFGYGVSKNFKETMKRFEKVELRGRYKEQY